MSRIILLMAIMANIIMLTNCNKAPEEIPSQKNQMQQVSLSDEEYIKRYRYWRDKYQMLRGLEETAERLRKKRMAVMETDKLLEFYIDREFCIEVKGEELVDGGIIMQFSNGGELIGIYNYLAGHATKSRLEDELLKLGIEWGYAPKGLVLDNDEYKHPKKSKDEILKQAEIYLNELAGERLKQYSINQPKISYDEHAPWFGVWEILWKRKLNEYEFLENSVEIRIHEKYGLCSFSWSMGSETCPTDIKISQKDAEEIAIKVIQGLFKSWACKFESYRPDLKAEVAWTKLWIVNPDYLFNPEKRSPEFPARSSKSMLAYRVSFKWCEYKEDWDKLAVDVDAATGEVLGGNLVMDTPNPIIITIPSK